jgi:aspartate aminotransferase/aromatic-amino-acid transaminase
MFDAISPAPPDAILGLTEAFKADPRPDKINLGVGVYKDDSGLTPIPRAVKRAEEQILAEEKSKGYLPIGGSPAYAAGIQDLLLGSNHPLVAGCRVRTAQTPGGTGALRVGSDFLRAFRPEATLWVSAPTWANHKAVFSASGFPVNDYAYYDPATHGLDFDALCAALRAVPAGDVVLLHVCCHNPSGVDPTPEQWETLADIAADTGWFPFFDFAYQGFGTSLEDDRLPLALFAERNLEFLVASSCSKNFGLYNERTGALSLVAPTPEAASAAFSHVEKAVRCNYSNPPRHGGAIVERILSQPDLRQDWEQELGDMRERIHHLRQQLTDTLQALKPDHDFRFIAEQKGMFSFSGLNADQVDVLRREHSIYIVGSGRINVAGITTDTLDRLGRAIASVL